MSNITSSSYPVVTLSKAGDQFVIVQGGQLKKLTRQGLQDFIDTLTATTFIELTDVPGSYVGQQGQALVVNPTEDGLEFQAATSGNFLSLADTPGSYGGSANKYLRVNGAETALEFIDDAFIQHLDTPVTYAGSSEYLVRVNTAADGLEFVTKESQQTTGWASYADTTYTAGSPFAVTAGTMVDLPNDAGAIIASQLPTGVASLYDGTVITPENDGDAWSISIRLTTESSINEGAIRLAIDIGGAQGEIVSDSRRLARGAGLPNQYAFDFTVFSGPTFVANGGTIRFEAIAGDQDVYNIDYFITRTHKAK